MYTLIPFLMLFIFGSYRSASEPEDLKKLSSDCNNFAFKLHRSFGPQGNVLISPSSIFILLGMLYKGARDSTAEQLRQTLGYDENIHQSVKNLLTMIEASPTEYQLEMANAIISQRNYPVINEFKDTLVDNYHALFKEVDFITENQQAVTEINNWVKETTHEKITKLLKELDPLTRMVLLNAVYFKGSWELPFHPLLTKRSIFRNNNIDPVTVPMMNIENTFRYGNFVDKGFQAISLPYKGGDIHMIILLPLEGVELNQIEQLNSGELNAVISRMNRTKLDLVLPKFNLKYLKTLKNNLKSLGIRDIFEESNADFSGIDGNKDLYVLDIIHKAVIDVNELGTEAAAPISAIIMSRVKKPVFLCNHPFMFFIRDKRTGIILFMGRVNEL